LYVYYSGPLTECLAGLGVDVSPEPGLTTFVENYGTDASWNPYDDVAALSPDEINRITPKCPQEPEGWSY